MASAAGWGTVILNGAPYYPGGGEPESVCSVTECPVRRERELRFHFYIDGT